MSSIFSDVIAFIIVRINIMDFFFFLVIPDKWGNLGCSLSKWHEMVPSPCCMFCFHVAWICSVWSSSLPNLWCWTDSGVRTLILEVHCRSLGTWSTQQIKMSIDVRRAWFKSVQLTNNEFVMFVVFNLEDVYSLYHALQVYTTWIALRIVGNWKVACSVTESSRV